MLFATSCPVCTTPGPAPCAGCADRLQPAPLLPPPAGVDGCVALVAYEGAGRALVTALKYRNLRAALRALAAAMATLVDPRAVDVVTWVPTTAARRRARGFDQAELLARAVAGHLRRPCRALLRRGPGPPQTGLRLPDRRAGPVFTVRDGRGGRGPTGARSPGRVLLVDDVHTSGATLAAAARALRQAGATRVWAVTLAQTARRS